MDEAQEFDPTIIKLNFKSSPYDGRDFKFALSGPLLSEEEMPTEVDLSSSIPEVYDQGSTGSCTSQSTGMAVLFQSRLQKREIFPSRLFLYYNGRVIEGSQNADEGAYIRDIFKTLNKEGVAKESTWPFIESQVNIKPSGDSYSEGLQTISKSYHKLNNSIVELKNCISQGKPFVFGFDVYSSFMYGSWPSIMPIPNTQKEQLLGGHAVCAIGYSDSKQAFKIKNSWGSSWKDKGCFWMPYSFITSGMCDDFWTLESLIEASNPVPPAPVPPTPDPTPIPGGCLDPFKLFNSFKELKTFSKSFLLKLTIQLGLTPSTVSKESLLILLKTSLNL